MEEGEPLKFKYSKLDFTVKTWFILFTVSVILFLSFFVYVFYEAGRGDEYTINWPGRYPDESQIKYGKLMDIEDIEKSVEEYILNFEDELQIGDIFVYEDTDYYVSIEEVETGKGAMELLVNPYTGFIYPEHGPNMMWNEKYGMHGKGHMMWRGRRDYESGEYRWYFPNEQQIQKGEAVHKANEYIQQYFDSDAFTDGQGHDFYGYYTFHIKKGEDTVGMLSVNQYTGDVWFHSWHGEIVEVIPYHGEHENE